MLNCGNATRMVDINMHYVALLKTFNRLLFVCIFGLRVETLRVKEISLLTSGLCFTMGEIQAVAKIGKSSKIDVRFEQTTKHFL